MSKDFSKENEILMKEIIKQYNHEYSCLSYLDVYFNNEGEMSLFFIKVNGCTKLYEGKPRYFTTEDLRIIHSYGQYKMFWNIEPKPSSFKKIEEDYIRVIK